MAYIIGLETEKNIAEMERRGWAAISHRAQAAIVSSYHQQEIAYPGSFIEKGEAK